MWVTCEDHHISRHGFSSEDDMKERSQKATSLPLIYQTFFFQSHTSKELVKKNSGQQQHGDFCVVVLWTSSHYATLLPPLR